MAKLRLQELIFCEKYTDRRSESEFVSFGRDYIDFSKQKRSFPQLGLYASPGPDFFVQNERRGALSPNLILSMPVSALPASFV